MVEYTRSDESTELDNNDAPDETDRNVGTTVITQRHDPPLTEEARENDWDVFKLGDVLPISRDTKFRVSGRHVVPETVCGLDSLESYARTEVEYDAQWMNSRKRTRDMDKPDTSYVLHLVTVIETGKSEQQYLVPAYELQEHASFSDEPADASFTVQANISEPAGLAGGEREVILSIPSTGSNELSGYEAESLAAILEQHASNPAIWPLVNADSAQGVLEIVSNLRDAAHVMQVRERSARVSADDES